MRPSQVSVMVSLVLLALCYSAFAGPTRGILKGPQATPIPPPSPINPERFSAELATLQPLAGSVDWTKLTVTLGFGITIPQPSGAWQALVTPDRVVGFAARTANPSQPMRLGATLDWDLPGVPLALCAAWCDHIGGTVGVKATLLEKSF